MGKIQGSIFRHNEIRGDSRDPFGLHRHAAFRCAHCRRRCGNGSWSFCLSRLRFFLTRVQRPIRECFAQGRNHRMIHHTCHVIRIFVFLWFQFPKPTRIRQHRATKSLLRRPAQPCVPLCLFASPLHENPLRDARLHVHFDQLIENFNHLFAQIRTVIQTRQFERLERSLRAARNVLQHHFRRLHDASPRLRLAGNVPRDVQHTVITVEVNGQNRPFRGWLSSQAIEMNCAVKCGRNHAEELNAR